MNTEEKNTELAMIEETNGLNAKTLGVIGLISTGSIAAWELLIKPIGSKLITKVKMLRAKKIEPISDEELDEALNVEIPEK